MPIGRHGRPTLGCAGTLQVLHQDPDASNEHSQCVRRRRPSSSTSSRRCATRRCRVAVLGANGRTAARPLHFLGFRELAPGVHLRPDNLVGGVSAVREQLRALGLPADAIVTGLDDLDQASATRARGLWDIRGLRASYRKARTALARSQRRLARLGSEAAMVESFLLGGRVIRQLVLDPLLPEPLLPAAERAALLAAMRAYDRVGRACWAAFMRG